MRDWNVIKRWRVDLNDHVYEWHVLRIHKDWPPEVFEDSAGVFVPLPRIDVYVVRK